MLHLLYGISWIEMSQIMSKVAFSAFIFGISLNYIAFRITLGKPLI